MRTGLYRYRALTLADRGEDCTLKPYFYIIVEHFLYSDLSKRIFQTSGCKPRNQCQHQQHILRPILLLRGSEKCVVKGLLVCALDRAISKLPFGLDIGPICSWQALESENKWRHFWSWQPRKMLVLTAPRITRCCSNWASFFFNIPSSSI